MSRTVERDIKKTLTSNFDFIEAGESIGGNTPDATYQLPVMI